MPFYAARSKPGAFLHQRIFIGADISRDDSCFSILQTSDLLYLYVRAGIALAVAYALTIPTLPRY